MQPVLHVCRWTSAHETCPICREPLVGEKAPAAAPSFSQGAYEQEVLYRIMRLQTCARPHILRIKPSPPCSNPRLRS